MIWTAVVITSLVPLGLVYVFAGEKARNKASEWLAKDWARLLLIYVLILLTYSHFAVVSNQWNSRTFLSIVGYFGIPTIAFILLRREDIQKASPRVFYFFLAFFVLMLWIPMELKWVDRKWVELPIGEKKYSLPSGMYFAILYGMMIFTGWFRIDLNCHWRLRFRDFLWAVGMLAALMLIILPLALAIDFVKLEIWDVAEKHFWVPLLLFPLFLVTPAIGEELVYRGVLQNSLEKKWGIWAALAIQAVIFGVSHINNKAGGCEFPNFPYVIFSAIAGLGYGIVFWRTRSLLASATTHVLVDLTWKVFFMGDG